MGRLVHLEVRHPADLLVGPGYDILYFITKVAEQAGSVQPTAMLKAIPKVTYEGICTTYKADALQVLSHSADIVKFDAAGKESVAKHMTFEPGALPFTVVTTTTVATTTTAPRLDRRPEAPRATRERAVSNFTALLASGLAEGAIAALAAVGFLLTYKATGVINFAQGALITLGAYVAIWVTQKDGMFNLGALDPVPGYLVTIGIMFIVGMVLERLAYAPLRGRSVHVVVIATLGAAIVVQAFIGLWQGTTPKFLDSAGRG